MDPPPPPISHLDVIPSDVVTLITRFTDLPEVIRLRSTNRYFNTLTREPSFINTFNNRENSPVWLFGHRLTQEHPHLGVIYGTRLDDGSNLISPVIPLPGWGVVEMATLIDVSGSNCLLYLEPENNLVVVNPFTGASYFISLAQFLPIVFESPMYITILSDGDDFLVECMHINEVDSDTYLSIHTRHPNWREVDPPYNTIERLRHVVFDRTMNIFSETTGELHTLHILGNDINAQVYRVSFPLDDLYYSDSDSNEDPLRYNYVLFGNCILVYTTRELSNDLCIVEAVWLSFRYQNILFDYHRRVPDHLLTHAPILLTSVSAYQAGNVVYIQFSSGAVEALGNDDEINVYTYQEDARPQPWARETIIPIAGTTHTGAFFTSRLTLSLLNNIN